MRKDPAQEPIVYSWSNLNDGSLGSITFEPVTSLLYLKAPVADMLKIETYVYSYDLQLCYPNDFSGIVKDLAQGTLTFVQGNSR